MNSNNDNNEIQLVEISSKDRLYKESTLISEIINDGAISYKDIVPNSLLKNPFSTPKYVNNEVDHGVKFIIARFRGFPVGVVGYQKFDTAFLIRHFYVKKKFQKIGIGTTLFYEVMKKTTNSSIYVGCFKAATWAVKFYKKKGFSIVDKEKAITLRKKYWRYGVDHIENTYVMTTNH